MPSLVIQKADGARQSFSLEKDRITLGRSRDSDVFLPDQWLSRHHAEILRAQEGFILADLGSKNGTLLNGERVGEGHRLETAT
jgi:pSer/pThr/pTyr-binding forkhead associated (FHA) protein